TGSRACETVFGNGARRVLCTAPGSDDGALTLRKRWTILAAHVWCLRGSPSARLGRRTPLPDADGVFETAAPAAPAGEARVSPGRHSARGVLDARGLGRGGAAGAADPAGARASIPGRGDPSDDRNGDGAGPGSR